MKRKLPRLAALVALAPMVWLSTVAALGLGDIDVRSRLNQRLVASIPLTAVGGEEADNIRVSLAGSDDFSRAGIERSDYLATLNFRVATDGAPRIEISSTQVAREPFLNFLLEVRGADGRILREYTVLLDPPEMAGSQAAVLATPRPALSAAQPLPPAAVAPPTKPVATAPVAVQTQKPVVAAVPAATESVAVESAEAGVDRAESSSETYGPVRKAETLWSIATLLRPDSSITMDQVLLAIYRGNPRAFDGGGINGLMRGARLQVPTAAQMREVSPDDAKAEVARLRGLKAPEAGTSRARSPQPVAATPVVAPRTIQPITAPTTAEAAVEAPATIEPEAAAATSAPATTATGGDAEGATVSTAVAAPAAIDPAQIEPMQTEAAPTDPASPQTITPAADEEIMVSGPIGHEKQSGLIEALLLPLVLGLALLGAVGYLLARILARRREQAEQAAAAAAPRPKMTLKAAPSAKSAVAAVAGTAATAQRLSAQEELDRLQASLDETIEQPANSTQQFSADDQAADASLPAADATQIFDGPLLADAGNSEPVDFDLTGQFEAQTVQINLDANDPLSEADFHLAYGLYDEAALLLKQAAEKEPARLDLRVKLAETYFAAGRADEFEQVAAELQAKLSAGEWQKLAIMGQQLCPGSTLFAAAGAASAVAVDMTVDAPAAADGPADDAGLDFRLEDLELPSLDHEAPVPVGAPAAVTDGNALEFDLSQFDLDPKPAAAAATLAPVTADQEKPLEFDLGQFDIDAAPTADVDPAALPAAEALIDLEEFDIGEDIEADSTTISADEAGTKLDLARAYVDMGDNEMARSLLGEVLEQGSEDQKRDAQALIVRLG